MFWKEKGAFILGCSSSLKAMEINPSSEHHRERFVGC
jgi:hypothetical protein